MLWGSIVAEGKAYALPKDSEYELLHISNAALSKTSEAGKTHLMISKGKETYTIGVLQKDKVESVVMDIYVRASQEITLTVSGKGEVHVTGYFEPTGMDVESEDEDAFMEGRLDEEEESGSEEEVKPAPIVPAKKKEEKKKEEKKKEEKKKEEKKKEEKKKDEKKKDEKKKEEKKKEEKKKEEKKKEEKKPEPKKVEAAKPAPKQPEAPKAEQFGGKKVDEDSDEDDEELLKESEPEDEDKLKKMIAEKKRASDKPLAPPTEAKKAKMTEAGGQAPKAPQGEGKKKKKKNKDKKNKPQPPQ